MNLPTLSQGTEESIRRAVDGILHRKNERSMSTELAAKEVKESSTLGASSWNEVMRRVKIWDSEQLYTFGGVNLG